MITYIEMWRARPAWRELPKSERRAYLSRIGPHMQELLGKGVQVLSWGSNEPGTHQRASYDYFAVWSFPDQKSADDFEARVSGGQWHEYFEQINLRGTTETPDKIIEKLVAI